MRGLIHGTMHLSIGQEASAVGTCMPLQRRRHITSTHRGHGHCIAKGAESRNDVRRVLRQGDRLLPRPRRLDAYCRCRKRQSRRQWHCRRRPADRRRCGALRQEAEDTTMLSSAFSATAPTMRAPSTRRSTWRRSGSCRSSSSARTTNTACRSRPSARWRSRNVADRASAYNMPGVIVDGNICSDVAEAVARGGRRARRGRGADADRMQDLSLPRPFQERPQSLSHQGRDRGMERSRPDRTFRRPS